MVELLGGPWGPVLIFGLRVVDVSMATVRVMLLMRGKRMVAPLIGFFEILVWIVAIGAAVQNLNSPLHVLGYAGGYAAGTAVGMQVERWLAVGTGVVRAITRRAPDVIAIALRDEGFGVTEQQATGLEGPVSVLYSVVPRRHVARVIQIVERHDPDAFVTVHHDVTVRGGWLRRSRHI